jgi:ethanolamine utilization protein EutA (predicted chaperonin)
MTQPPSYQTSIFNSSFFKSNTDALTLADADNIYLQLGGGTIGGSLYIAGNCDVGSFSIGGATISFDAISGVVAGVAQNKKALILGASGEIARITSLTATNIYGSVKTAIQCHRF